MSGISFVPLGVGDAFSRRHYSFCLALEADGHWLLVDCPHPIRKMMNEAGEALGVNLDIDQFEAVVLTHLHGDHSSGLEDLGFYAAHRLGRKMTVVVQRDVAADLWPRRLSVGMDRCLTTPNGEFSRMIFEDFFKLALMGERRTLDIGPFSIECRKTIHHVPTTALRIAASGRMLGISSDTAYDPDLIAWLSEADLIIHETGSGMHTPYSELIAQPATVLHKLRLIHYPDDFDTQGSAIETLREGFRYWV